MLNILDFEEKLQNRTDYKNLCHAKSIKDLSCNDDAFESPLKLFEAPNGTNLLPNITQNEIREKLQKFLESSVNDTKLS